MVKVAVVGTGLVGRAWSIVFARAGFDVAMWDAYAPAVGAARDFIGRRLPELGEAGLLKGQLPEQVMARLATAPSLAAALASAEFAQESGPERVADKLALFTEMDRLAPPETIFASSTSTIRASVFSEAVPGRARCLVAHPVNPPYLIPLVELSPAPWTDAAVVDRTCALMQNAGMVTAVVKREVDGFILNRLQAALLSEAMSLIEAGTADAEDIDATVKHGLGLRWSFMGPFETIDLNAPGGLTDYCGRYGPSFVEMMTQSKPSSWSRETIEALDRVQRARTPAGEHTARQEWRDRRLMALLAHKATQPG
ncbi:3-hydroxyacyl-CoA dehydrogenase [Lichenicoccus sp.]|uniref:3-hydroxyacyl-CoA dehydrogenase n=1 Tax=Lichenicoccus sp. TaxID=2781899 RepID=UPI003D0AEEE1